MFILNKVEVREFLEVCGLVNLVYIVMGKRLCVKGGEIWGYFLIFVWVCLYYFNIGVCIDR